MHIPLFAVLALLAWQAIAGAQDRFALVIGNGRYVAGNPLKNPPNDAVAMAAALEKLDFRVTRKIDTDLTSLEKSVIDFRKTVTKKSIALVFYAGHGLQVKGENFLVPVDAVVQEESQVRRKCYPIDELLGELESSEAALKVVILDSCRDNPLTRGWTRSNKAGLATIAQVPDGTIIAFSTAPGQVALDGRGENSPFTKHLVASLERRPAEGLEMFQVMRTTGQAVSEEIGQRPWMNFDTSLKDFYLWRGNVPPPKQLPADLTAGLDLNEASLEGDWFRRAGLLVSPTAAFAQLKVADHPPADYRLEFYAVRRQGKRPLTVGLPVGNFQCTVALDETCVLHSVAGKSVNGGSLPGTLNTKLLYRFDVGARSMNVECDNREVLRWSGDPQQLSTPGTWKTVDRSCVFLGTVLSEFEISKLSLTELRK